MKALILTLLAAILSISAFAQTDSYEGFDIYGLGTNSELKKSTFGIELGLGGASSGGNGADVEVGIRFQRNINKYLSWDILHFRYGHTGREYEIRDVRNYTREVYPNVHKISVMTGVRVFTPAFNKKKTLKVFTALDLGYGPSVTVTPEEDMYDKMDYFWDERFSTHSFALDFSAGLQIKKFHLAYGLNSHHKDGGKMLEHTFRIGLDL